MSVEQHRQQAPAPASIRVSVITVSDSRTADTDGGGALVAELAQAHGHDVVARERLPDEPAQITGLVKRQVLSGGVDVIVLTGGTGLSHRDTTIEAVTPVFEKHIDGFGELFRALSYAEVGPAAMLSRASAGAAGPVAVFCLPGSPAAVRLALEKLILPELGHLISQLRRDLPPPAPHGHGHGHGSRHP